MYKVISISESNSSIPSFIFTYNNLRTFILEKKVPLNIREACIVHLFQYASQNADLTEADAALLNWEQSIFQKGSNQGYVRTNLSEHQDVIACRKQMFSDDWPYIIFVQKYALRRVEGQCRLKHIGALVGTCKKGAGSFKTFANKLLTKLERIGMIGFYDTPASLTIDNEKLFDMFISQLFAEITKQKIGASNKELNDLYNDLYEFDWRLCQLVVECPINDRVSVFVSSEPFPMPDKYKRISDNSKSILSALNKSGGWPAKRDVWSIYAKKLLTLSSEKINETLEELFSSTITAERVPLKVVPALNGENNIGKFYQKVWDQLSLVINELQKKNGNPLDQWILKGFAFYQASWSSLLPAETQVILVHRALELVLLVLDCHQDIFHLKKDPDRLHVPYAMTALNTVQEAFSSTMKHTRIVTTGRNYFEMLSASIKFSKNRWATVATANTLYEIDASEWLRLLEKNFEENTNLNWESLPLLEHIMSELSGLEEDQKQEAVTGICSIFKEYKKEVIDQRRALKSSELTDIEFERLEFRIERSRNYHLELLSGYLKQHSLRLKVPVNMIIVEIHPNNVTARLQHRQKIDEWLPAYMEKRGSEKQPPLCLVLDLTCNSVLDSEVKKIIMSVNEWVDSGELAVVVLESGTKFASGGTDAFSGGRLHLNAKDDYWKAFKKECQQMSIPNNSAVSRAFDLFQSPGCFEDSLEQSFLNLLREATREFKERYHQKMSCLPIEREQMPVDISVSTDRESVVVSLNLGRFLMEGFHTNQPFNKYQQRRFVQRLVKDVMIPISRIRQSPVTARQSLGFANSTLNDCETTIRLTCGVGVSEEIDDLIQLIADINIALMSCPKKEGLVKSSTSHHGYFSKWVKSVQEICQKYQRAVHETVDLGIYNEFALKMGMQDGYEVPILYVIDTDPNSSSFNQILVLNHIDVAGFYNADPLELSRILLMQLPWNFHDNSLHFTLTKNECENSITVSTFDLLPFETDFYEELGCNIKISNPEDGFEESLIIDSISFEEGEFHAELVVTKEWQETVSENNKIEAVCDGSDSEWEDIDESELFIEELFFSDNILIQTHSVQDPAPLSAFPDQKMLFYSILYSDFTAEWSACRSTIILRSMCV